MHPYSLLHIHQEHCAQLSRPDLTNFVVSVFLLFGILVSYLPQHWRIVARRSSEGLSPYFVLLGATSCTCAFANILVLPTSQQDVLCCREISSVACAAGLLGIAQVGVQWSCFFLILLLFLVFAPRQGPEHRSSCSSHEPSASPWSAALVVGVIATSHLFVTILVSIALFARRPERLQEWANILGIMAAALACIQYFPQLWMTYKLGSVMSLSIPMMCIQTPGSFVFATSLAVRLGASGWSAWGVYLVTGFLQGGLLVMGIIFEMQDRRRSNMVVKRSANGPSPRHLDPTLLSPVTEDDATATTSHAQLERQPLLEATQATRSTSNLITGLGIRGDPSPSKQSAHEGAYVVATGSPAI